MERRLKPRQQRILEALLELGGEATTRMVAIATVLNVNGVSQSLSALANAGWVTCLGGRGGDCRWNLVQ